jgi:carboxylate-amine ligase
MRNWSEYVWLIKHLVDTKFIETIREIWWDVRPHHNFGTVEIRVCDMPLDLNTVLALTAIVQSLVHALSQQIDSGTYLFDCHPMMVRQNKWRATRYGLDAVLVDPYTQDARAAREVVLDMVDRLQEHAEELHCADYLGRARDLVHQPTGAERQRAIHARTGSLVDVVRECVAT